MTLGEAAAPREKVAIGKTITLAVRSLIRNLPAFAKIAALPLMLAVLLTLGNQALYPSIRSAIGWQIGFGPAYLLDSIGLESLLETLLFATALAIFASHWMQYLMASGHSRPRCWFWSWRDLRILLYAPLLATLSLLVILDASLAELWEYLYFDEWLDIRLWLSVIPFWQSLILMVIIDALLLGRLGAALAATAAGSRLGLIGAWRMTRGQTLQLILLWLVLYRLPLIFVNVMQAWISRRYGGFLAGGFDTDLVSLHTQSTLVWEILLLPQRIGEFAVMALGASLFVRVYKGRLAEKTTPQDEILERFE